MSDFFRKSRRRVATYIGVVVLVTCVLSGLLGAMLRVSHGDLMWATVTQAGTGGVVQVGNIDVQSARLSDAVGSFINVTVDTITSGQTAGVFLSTGATFDTLEETISFTGFEPTGVTYFTLGFNLP